MKVEPILEQAAAAAAQQQAEAAAAAVQRQEMTQEEARARRQAADPNFQAGHKGRQQRKQARPREPEQALDSGGAAGAEPRAMPPPPPKRAKTVAAAGGGHAPADVAGTGDEPQGGSGGRPEAGGVAAGEAGPASEPAAQQQQHIVFVKHLPPNVTKADLERLFADCGPVREIRLGYNPVTKKPKAGFHGGGGGGRRVLSFVSVHKGRGGGVHLAPAWQTRGEAEMGVVCSAVGPRPLSFLLPLQPDSVRSLPRHAGVCVHGVCHGRRASAGMPVG